MKKSIITLLLLSMLFSCKKDEPKQYSTWYVNGEKFTTNEVELTQGKQRSILSTVSQNNGFRLDLDYGYLLEYPELINDCGSFNPSHTCFIIFYNSKYYKPKGGILYAKSVNNKAQFTMNETWYYSGNDSILVKGTFNKP